MKECTRCGSHAWFMERIWNPVTQREEYRVVCKPYGHSGWFEQSEKEAIEAWNQRQETLKT